MSNLKLLPCPFCGGEVKYYRPSHHIEHFVNKNTVYCEHCDYLMEGVSALQLMQRWNTRKPMDDIRNKTIDEFAEEIQAEISESIIWDMLVTMNKNGSISDTSDKIVDYVIDTSLKIAEQLKARSDEDAGIYR